ncbi:MAG: hypothetical protein IPK15_07670 [Verrucomicrobia bacterium]|nr:hypothetical protein [Verrucomicrobiota bacterium]
MKTSKSTVLRSAVFLLGAILPLRAADPPKLTAAQTDFFETKVRPVLIENCYAPQRGEDQGRPHARHA